MYGNLLKCSHPQGKLQYTFNLPRLKIYLPWASENIKCYLHIILLNKINGIQNRFGVYQHLGTEKALYIKNNIVNMTKLM